MKGIKGFFKHTEKWGNKDLARIKIGPLMMELEKIYDFDTPHEVTLVIPRVEIRKKVQTPLFTFAKEIIYNSVTIVDAPRHPLAGERAEKKALSG